MKKFKKGDRVRTTGSIGIDNVVPIGSEGVITYAGSFLNSVLFDCFKQTTLQVNNDDLVRLIDPPMITTETKLESFEKIQAVVTDRHEQCLEGLNKLGQATANELAKYLREKGITPFFNRNFVHPRLNELVAEKKVKIVGKKKDSITDRTCAIYEVNKN